MSHLAALCLVEPEGKEGKFPPQLKGTEVGEQPGEVDGGQRLRSVGRQEEGGASDLTRVPWGQGGLGTRSARIRQTPQWVQVDVAVG